MRLLSRYLLRQLAAPFLFALAALTGFMILNQVAKRFGALVGKGLEWSVIGEVFLLSIPFIVAMTLPMAVLVAVLHTFSHLAADNEITAMRASGIGPWRTMWPVLAWGLLMAVANFGFVDQVLPRSNARLRALYTDIGQKKPTFSLREQVINEIPPSPYFLRAGRIDAATGRLRGVTIFDVGGDGSRRVIYADSGFMAYAPDGKDLTLRLYDGQVHEYRSDERDQFQLTDFRISDFRVRNVFDSLQRSTGDLVRGDREMSTCEMLQVVHSADADRAAAARERHELVRHDLRTLLGLSPLSRLPALARDTAPRGYCAWGARLRESFQSRTAEAQPATQPAARSVTQAATQGAAQATAQAAAQATAQPQMAPAPPRRPGLTSWGEVASVRDRMRDAGRRGHRYDVEVHKKWAISVACLSFVLIGIAMALRFPRGGMGLVMGGGFFVFAVWYIGLTAGESLADRGFVSPVLAMWAPNILLTLLGAVALVRVNRESGSTRGGDLQEIVDAVRGWIGRRLRRRSPAGSPAGRPA